MPKLIGFVAHCKTMILRNDFAVIADGGENDKMRAGAERADLGELRRTEAARESKLPLAADFLAAKQQHRVLFECRTNGIVGRIVIGDVGQRHAADFGAKTWTNLDDIHRQILRLFSLAASTTARITRLTCILLQNRFAGKKPCKERDQCAGRTISASPRSQNSPAIRPRPSRAIGASKCSFGAC